MSIEEIRASSIDRMTDEQVRELLTSAGVGVLGLSDEEVPYLLPMSFGYDGESALYFVFLLFGAESRKEVLSERVERARFLVYSAESAHEWRSVSAVGSISAVADDEWAPVRDAMRNAWHPDLFSSAAPMQGIRGYRFRIEEWTGIESTG